MVRLQHNFRSVESHILNKLIYLNCALLSLHKSAFAHITEIAKNITIEKRLAVDLSLRDGYRYAAFSELLWTAVGFEEE